VKYVTVCRNLNKFVTVYRNLSEFRDLSSII
jgi:hypothetical protein